MADRDEFNNPTPHQAPKKNIVDAVVDGAIKAGSSAVSLLSGLLAAVLILYSGYVLYDTLDIERSAFSSAWDMLQFKPELIEDYDIPMSSSTLEDINKDYRAWLTVYETNIDYPVMQGPDDLYYAYHDIYKRDSLTGAIYLAAENRTNLSDSYNVIYGHHMDNGAMFGGLDRFVNNGYFDAHRTGMLVTPRGAYDIEFFAVASTDAYESQIYTVGNRAEAVKNFLASGGAGGVGLGTTVHRYDAEVAATADKVVALSTCAAGDGTSGRLVVFGKLSEHIVYTSLTVTKVWDDNSNQDGKRPNSLTVRLMSEGEEIRSVVLREDNEWTATVDNIPIYRNWTPILYSWQEDGIEAYTLIGNVTEGTVTTLTNQHIPETTTLTVAKVWNDDNNRDGIRPENLNITLRADGDDIETVTLNEGNGWTASVENQPVYKSGLPIAYTWHEEELNGYEAGQEIRESMTVITNTHDIATTDLMITKEWRDNNNQDGIRPAKVIAILSANDSPVKSVELNASNEWTATVAGLPVNEAGVEINYSWTEEPVADYTLTKAINGTATTLINTHTPETKSLTVIKIWDDNEDQDGIRPGTLQVTLSNGNTVSLNAGNNWTDTIDDLPVYANGREIEYSWTEENVEGYEQVNSVTNGNTTIITNRHETDTTVATVVKVWRDDNNRDGIRPDEITVTLSNGEQRTLNAGNNWTATISGLPMNAAGQPIPYSWTEDNFTGYTLSTSVDGTTTTLTNTHEIATKDLTVVKVWDDHDNQDGIRPGSVTVTLSEGTQVVLDADHQWTATVSGLPVNENGRPIAYTWTEEPVTGYTASAKVNENVTTLTNTHEPEVTSLTVSKVWEDDGNRDGIRPESLEATLYANGETVNSVNLNEENRWTATLDNLPVNKAGVPIAYEWQEATIEDYDLTGQENTGTLTVLTNTHKPEVASLTLVKRWEDDDNRDGLRPASLAVALNANGKVIFTTTLTPANNWTVTVADLPVKENGTAIAYTWSEAETEGYTLTEQAEGTTTTFVNRHEIATTTRTVIKNWNDNENQDGARPAAVTVILNANGEAIRTLTLNAGNNWRATVENLPVNDHGEAINYTWTERAVADYTLSNTNTIGTTTTLTNTHAPELISVSIRKLWADQANQYGTRPESLTVYLINGSNVVGTGVLTPNNNWSATITGLQRYESGTELEYRWVEPEVPGYTQRSVEVEGYHTEIVNAMNPRTENPAEYTLTIYYRYPDGRPAAPTYTDTYHEGDPYDIASPQIDGYRATLLRVTGVMPGRDVTYTVIYLPVDDTTIIEDVDTPLGLGRVVVNVGDCLE